MAQFNRLHAFYSFPGFTPQATIRGVFGDPYAAIVTLRRHPQKHSAANAGSSTAPSTIKASAGSVTSIAAGIASIWSSTSAGSIAASATP